MSKDNRHTWRFEAPDQMIAVNTIEEVDGFRGVLYMDFTEPTGGDAIISVEVVGITAESSEHAGDMTLADPVISNDQHTVELPVTGSAVNLFFVVVRVVTALGDTILRRGNINFSAT